MSFLLWPEGFSHTARAIAECLGIENGNEHPNERRDFLIRWGSVRSIPYVPTICTINKRDAIARNTDKLRSLQIMQNAGVNVPRFSRLHNELHYPLIGRSSNHHGGGDIKLYMQSRDIEVYGPSDFYVEFIPKVREFRVHVVDGRAIGMSEQVYDAEGRGEYNPIVWNWWHKHFFRRLPAVMPEAYMAVQAVQSLGLDFGSVDCIIGHDGRLYILEVNTAPGLDADHMVEAYAEALLQLMQRLRQSYNPSTGHAE